MIERLARSASGVFLLLGAYFLINVAIRLATPHSLELDEGQQLYFAQWLILGYGPQPPLYNWIQYGVVQVLGNNMLALTLLKNSILFLSYLFFGLTAQIVLRDRVLAVMATLGLFAIPQISYESQRDLTHTVAMFFAACLFLFALVRTLERPSVVNYGLAGLAVGLGMLSKYNFVLLPASAFIVLAIDRQFRARLLDPRVLATFLVAAIVVAPHAYWFLDHMGEATSSTMNKLNRDSDEGAGRLAGLLSLIEAVAAISLPTLIVFLVAFGRSLRDAWHAESQWTRLFGRMLVVATLLLVVIVLSGAASYIRHRWLIALFLIYPLYLACKIEASGAAVTAQARRRFAIPIVAVMIIVPLILLARPLWLAPFGYYSKQNVPYGPAFAGILASNGDAPAIALAEDQQLAGNMKLFAPQVPVIAPEDVGLDIPFQWGPHRPVLAVWRDRLEGDAETVMPGDMSEWLKAHIGFDGPVDVRYVTPPYHHGKAGDVYTFSYAWIYPPAGSQP